MNSAYWVMLFSWIIVALWIVMVIYTNRKVHPRALFALFFVELWERFSYYGMRAFLVLFLTSTVAKGGFGFEEKDGNSIYAAYGSLVYLTPLLGGFLADKYLGFRRSIIWGAILMASAQFTLAYSTTQVESGETVFLLAGLALLTIGNGFFKPNISSLVGKFYGPGDGRRDGAFTIFYMGINLGAYLAPVTCAAVGELEGWVYGFLLAGTGMIIGLIAFLITVWSGVLVDKANPPESITGVRISETGITDVPEAVQSGSKSFDPAWFIYLGTFLLIPIGGLLIKYNDIMDYLLGSIGLATTIYLIVLSFRYPIEERQRLWVILVLLIFTTVFWMFFELAASALNLFAKRNVEKSVLGAPLTTTFFQAVNPGFIMIFAPIFSALWIYLSRRNSDLSAPVKFALGLGLLGVGFLMLPLGRPFVEAGMMPAIFLILLYMFHTLGELTLSPVGLSLVTKLSPPKIVGFMFGCWFLSNAIAHQAGKSVGNLTLVDKSKPPEEALEQALTIFTNIGFVAIGSGVLLLLLSRQLVRWMHGVK